MTSRENRGSIAELRYWRDENGVIVCDVPFLLIGAIVLAE
jgi:hypothetical protein